MWVDAFQRDTQHLQADEVGAYMLILMAMWTREDCDFPDDDARLARVSRVSTRLWRSRIGPVIREFLHIQDGCVISQRLRKEATYVERVVTQQSDRKSGKKHSKPLQNNNQSKSTDNPTDKSTDNPTQQPNNPTEVKREAKASQKRASRLSEQWTLPRDWGEWAVSEGWPVSVVRIEAEKFRDYWVGVGGQKGTKLDWLATWRNWMRNSNSPKSINGGHNEQPTSKSKARMDAFIAGARGAGRPS